MTKTIEQRIEALERQNRRLKLVGGTTVGLVLAALAVGQATSKKAEPPAWKGRVIEAEKFVLRDKNGKARAALRTFRDSAGLVMYDKDGKTRLDLTMDKVGPALVIRDANGKTRITLGECLGSADLRMNHSNGKRSVSLSTNLLGPNLELMDSNGKVIWEAP